MGFLGIPGLSFSLKRAVGVTKVKQKIARKTGVPTTSQGRIRKSGKAVENLLSGKKSREIARNYSGNESCEYDF